MFLSSPERVNLIIFYTFCRVFLSKHEKKLQDTFNLLHNDIGLSHELLSKFPSALLGKNKFGRKEICQD
jgi:hypothetical protein